MNKKKKKKCSEMNTAYENMYVLDKLRQRSLLNRCKAAKMEKEIAVHGALFIIALSSNRAKENSAKQDGKRSG